MSVPFQESKPSPERRFPASGDTSPGDRGRDEPESSRDELDGASPEGEYHATVLAADRVARPWLVDYEAPSRVIAGFVLLATLQHQNEFAACVTVSRNLSARGVAKRSDLRTVSWIEEEACLLHPFAKRLEVEIRDLDWRPSEDTKSALEGH